MKEKITKKDIGRTVVYNDGRVVDYRLRMENIDERTQKFFALKMWWEYDDEHMTLLPKQYDNDYTVVDLLNKDLRND